MRKAFFVIGCESSGTRMLTESLISAGAYGDYAHVQRMDDLNFYDLPDVIAFRRSLPHARSWPPINALYNMMTLAGYEVITLIMWRKEKYTVLSQLKLGHVDSEEQAKKHIAEAFSRIGKFSHGKECEVVGYEEFVTDPWYRSGLFWDYGLTDPTITYYNANEAYD